MAVIIALALAGLAVVVAANILGRRSGQPVAVLLVLVGLLYAVLPGPNLEVNPDVVLVGVLPPLLYATALTQAWSRCVEPRARWPACQWLWCWSPHSQWALR